MFVLRQGHLLDYFYNRFQWYYYPRYHRVSDFPLHVDLESSSKCNMHCPMCYRRRLSPSSIKVMDFDLALKIIDECAAHKLYSMRFSWRGEPFTNPRLVELLGYAKQKGIKNVSFLTNGLVLDEENSLALIRAGVDYISVSFDGIGENYNRIRHPARFEETYERLANFMRLRKKMGKIKPALRVCTIWPAISKNPDEYYRVMARVTDKIVFNPYIDFKNAPQPDHNFVCQYPWQRLIVASNGHVVPCTGDHMERYVLGDASKQSLYDIWHSEKLDDLRRKHTSLERLDIKACADCRHGTLRKDKYYDMDWEEVTRETAVGHSYIYSKDNKMEEKTIEK